MRQKVLFLLKTGGLAGHNLFPLEVFSMAIHKPLVIANAMRKPHVT